nr:hypothetical protein [uncultured Chryseobacterium sp.]
MSISYYDFKNLPSQSQYELVVAEGRVISETYKDGLKFVLYEVSSFSVEIVYNTINDKIASLSVFQKKGSL